MSDANKCHGIAGKIWFHGMGNVHTAVCEWPSNGDAVLKAQYASSLEMTVPEAESLNVRSKVFTGAQIVAKDQKWGVILLDSLKDDLIKDQNYEKTLIANYSELISTIINKVDI